jgi:hypothetical protein
MIKTETTQLDRIEAKLDQVLAFRDALLKLAMPRIPAGMREKAMELMAGMRQGD